MRGHSILIVESEVSSFVERLRDAIEQIGAETVVVRDPYSSAGRDHLSRFTFSAALVNVQHRTLSEQLGVPVLVYGGSEMPREPDAIVSKLKRLLDEAAP